MTVEIELKFIAAPQAVAALPQWLAARRISIPRRKS